MKKLKPIVAFILLWVAITAVSYSQVLYSARAYWEESTRPNFRLIQQKNDKGDSLTVDEKNYFQDYQAYLKTYFSRLAQTEVEKYNQLKDQWNRELITSVSTSPTTTKPQEIFELRGRDRLANIGYGLWYGISLGIVLNASGVAVTSIPLITGGLWALGPALNPKKYEGINRNTIRAGNTGRTLGLIYGGSLGFMIAGTSTGSDKLVFGLSTIGSIVLGEIAFQAEKKKHFSAGYIEMMRHYSLMGSWVGFSGIYSTGTTNANLLGAAVLGGGIAGLALGKRAALKYDYTLGDVSSISSLTNISALLGFAFIGNSDSNTAVLLPMAATIAASAFGQKAVRGAHLTDKQGEIIGLTSLGAVLIGFGIVGATKATSLPVILGVPGGMGLIAHQLMFHKFKMKNIELGLQGKNYKNNYFKVSLKVTPENYLLNQYLPTSGYSPETIYKMQGSLVDLRIKF